MHIVITIKYDEIKNLQIIADKLRAWGLKILSIYDFGVIIGDIKKERIYDMRNFYEIQSITEELEVKAIFKSECTTKLYFGNEFSSSYIQLLNMFAGTKINSNRTSSVPLVEFWKDTDSRFQRLLAEIDEVLLAQDISLCFEYPTQPKLGKGKASMTDLMIIAKNCKIAIEAKFTEYHKTKNTEKIAKWLKAGDHPENREKVLEYWKSLIADFVEKPLSDSINELEYQFFHRTASACCGVEKAYVVYQVFYDGKTKQDSVNYINKLEKMVKAIKPNENLKFFVWKVEVVQRIDDKEKQPFDFMKTQIAYQFKDEEIVEVR